MPRVIRVGDFPLMSPDSADLERKKKEEIKKAIKRIKDKKKLRKKEKSKNRRKRKQ